MPKPTPNIPTWGRDLIAKVNTLAGTVADTRALVLAHTLGQTLPAGGQPVDGWAQGLTPGGAYDGTPWAMGRVTRMGDGAYRPVAPGHVSALSTLLDGTLTGGAPTVTIFKNGVATGVSVTLTPGSPPATLSLAPGAVPFVWGDVVELRIAATPAIQWGGGSQQVRAAIQVVQ